VVGVLGVTQILAWGSSFYLPAILAGPIADETGWPLSLVVGGLSLGLLVSGLVSPQVGRLIQLHGGRVVLAGGAALIGLGLAGLGFAPALPFYLLAWVLIGAGMGAGLYDAAFGTLGRIYGKEARSAIVAVTLFGGFASTVCWPLSAVLLGNLGWRGACLAYAAIQLFFSLPLYFFLLPRAPADNPADREEVEGKRTPLLQVGQRLPFLLMGMIVTIAGAVSAIVAVHIIAIMQARGLAIAAAVALGALIGPAQVAARVVEMAAGRHYHPIWTLVAATILVLAGLSLLFFGPPPLAAALILYGAGNGVYSIARGTVPLTLFGAENYAALMGRLAFPSFVAQALSPPAAALILEHFGVHAVLTAIMAMAAANVAAIGVLYAVSRKLLRVE
jgi:MFS family permease